jgi:hypothetical protein
MRLLIPALLLCAACNLGPCPVLDCANDIAITVKDSSGNALTSYSGTVTVQERVVPVVCGGSSTKLNLPDGGTADNEAGCSAEVFHVFGGSAQTIEVDLTSGNLKFKGPVTVTFKSNRVGPSYCETSCTSGTGTATLQ